MRSGSAPFISAISPNGGVSGSNVYITLTGTSFGINGVVRIGPGVCDTASGVYQHVVINCAVPVGAGANLPVFIESGGYTSNVVRFSYSPIISSISITAGVAYTEGGATLQLVGTGFNVPGVAVATVAVGGRDCVVQSQSDVLVTCTLPVGQGATNAVRLTVAGQTSNSLNFVYASPVVESVWPASGPTRGGTEISIKGYSLGLGTATTVTIGGQACVVNTAKSNLTHVVCVTPAGSGAAQSLILTSAGLASFPTPWSYDLPVITGISPKNGVSSGGYPVTVRSHKHFSA
jgi:hypothetical protein